ncbi:putative chitinase [Seiridium cardinale]|uniref:chitinase n=1 Tax=Seiridium cardinale TaxID=138064 RepID=A0ABR2XMJ1_9PEZI
MSCQREGPKSSSASLFLIYLVLASLWTVQAQQGKCGFGSDFCGNGCVANCNAKPECGTGAPSGQSDCPLSVCCSQQGFCGTTDDFCDNAQGNSGFPIIRPDPQNCAVPSGANPLDALARVAYYDVNGASRGCDQMQPEGIPGGVLTHVNVAFEGVTTGNQITENNGPIVARVSRLKKRYNGLRVNIAVGGFDFGTSPDTQYYLSDMASSQDNRATFINSVVSYIQKFALNGIDLVWDFPQVQDTSNLVSLVSEMRTVFTEKDPSWEITVALPMQYLNMRYFNLDDLSDQVDFFNVMTYDLHGPWDQPYLWSDQQTGTVRGHADSRDIETGLDLLWRNGVTPDKVVMGLSLLGRGFLLQDTSCTTPGNCINSYQEIRDRQSQLGSVTSYNSDTTVKYMVYGSNQWISFDDSQSFEDKYTLLKSHCLRGLHIWSIDWDTAMLDGTAAIFGDDATSRAVLEDDLDDREATMLVNDLAAYTGQNCHLSYQCVSADIGTGPDPSGACSGGYSSVAVAHDPEYIGSPPVGGSSVTCDKGSWKHVCCPTGAMPKNCEWTPDTSSPLDILGICPTGCGADQFQLTRDSYADFQGNKPCGFFSKRSLCCDASEVVDTCRWTDDCATSANGGTLCNDDEEQVAERMDKADGGTCLSIQVGPVTGPSGPPMAQTYRAYCCPKADPLKNCVWSNDASNFPTPDPQYQQYQLIKECSTQWCPGTKLDVTKASNPQTLSELNAQNNNFCLAWQNLPGSPSQFSLCCDPPTHFNRNWPVFPAYLWSHNDNSSDADVTWEWADNFGNNDGDTTPNDLEDDPGSDPYGFIMLDGTPGSINQAFSKAFTVIQRDEPPAIVRRSSPLTSNRTAIDSTFDHSEGTIRVYCNHPHDSPQCRRVFYKGAKDTIIRLPAHIGEGPWARIVSMEPEPEAETQDQMPSWVLKKRSDADNRNGVYVVKYDYNFAAIQRKDDTEFVNLRVDYTNLADYWNTVTNAPPNSSTSDTKRKRSMEDTALRFHEWKARVDSAKEGDALDSPETYTAKAKFKRAEQPLYSRTNRDEGSHPDDEHETSILAPSTIEKRWFGAFVEWVRRVTTLTSTNTGSLPMGFSKAFTLYSGRLSCTNDVGVTLNAGLDITTDVALQMHTMYSYYLSGSIVPFQVNDAYAFVRVQPELSTGITINGNAELIYTSEVRKIIDTISYPGLAIKGIAAVGPTLDIYGQITGSVTIAGDMRIGAKYTFQPIEVYVPNDEATHDRATAALQDNNRHVGLEPVFEAQVKAAVAFDVRITPEVDMGIKVGGIFGTTSLVDAHVAAFANTSLHFYADVTTQTNGQDSNWSYTYGVDFLYRIGLTVVAQIYLYGRWQPGTYYPVDWQTIHLYGPIVFNSIPEGTAEKRSLMLTSEPLDGALFGTAKWPRLSSAGVELDTALLMTSNTTSVDELDDYTVYTRDDEGAEEEQEFPNKASTFQVGSFKCTTGPGRCSRFEPQADAAPANDKRRVGLISPIEHGGSLAPRVHQIQKRAPTDCSRILPRYYFNCNGFFQDVQLTGTTGATVMLPGICTSIRAFMLNRQIANEEYTLQWDPNGSGTRQRQACAGVCTADNRNKQMTLFGQSGRGIPPVSNCDEFPFAGSMEGGNGFIGLQSAANPLGVTRTCVAAYQNDLQGQCNSVLSSIRTNVNYFNDPNKPTEDNPLPKLWNDNGWTRKGAWGDNRQRLASYPATEPQPPSAGMSQADRSDPNNLGWFQKRNFTVQLAYTATSNPSASAFRPSSFTAGRIQDPSDGQAQQPSTHAVSANDASWIICAVNIQGQQRYSYSSFNGWCWDGQSMRDVWNRATYATLFGTFVPPQQFSYFACKIDFQGSPGLAKRDQVPLGFFGNDPIYNIERVHGPNTTFTVDVPLDQMPEAARQIRAEVQRERAAEFDAIQKLRLHKLKSIE